MSMQRVYDQLLKERIRLKTESEEESDKRKPDLHNFDAKMASLPNEMSILYEKKQEYIFCTGLYKAYRPSANSYPV